jgi:hypothetical protein
MVDRPPNDPVTTEGRVHICKNLSTANIHGIASAQAPNNHTDHEKWSRFHGTTETTVDQVEHFKLDGKIVLTEGSCYEELGFCFPT